MQRSELGVCGLLLLLAGTHTAAAGELSVVAISPAGNTVDAAATSTISVEFDRPLLPASVGSSSFWAFARWSGTVSGTYAFSNGDRTVNLTPDRPFSAGESVMVILSRDLEAADGSFLRDAGHASQFWVRSARTSLEFVELDRIDTDSPSRPYGGIGSDLDGDGYLDLTTVNEDTNDLRVFLNTGDGSGFFADFLQPTFGTGNVPSPSEPGDFDRDGNIDIALANTSGDSVSVLLGNGDGTFGPQQEVAVPGQPRGIALLDVDGDGDLDIATANRTTGLLSVLTNDGNGVFGNVTSFGTGSAGEWALAAGDMNGDGLFDLVAGGNSAQRVYVYTADGDGTFTLADDQSSGGPPWMLVLGDVDGDGNADVSVASNNGTGAILLGDGDGNLGSAAVYPVDPFALATDLADLDGDGDLDWITASFGGDWTLFENDGAGNFTQEREFTAPQAASCSLAMDIDNDGDLDLALIDELADEVIVMQNPGVIFADGFESGSTASWSAIVAP